MKKLLLISLLFFITTMVSQIEPVQLTPSDPLDFCKTPSISSSFSEMSSIKGLDHSNDEFYVQLYIHVLRDDVEPKHGQSIEGVNRILQTLYNDYDPLGIHFVWNGDIDYIDNHAFYIRPDLNVDAIFNTNNHQDGIDIYLFDDLDPAISFGTANGIGESTELMMGGYFFGYELVPLSWLKILSHEVGHVLYPSWNL